MPYADLRFIIVSNFLPKSNRKMVEKAKKVRNRIEIPVLVLGKLFQNRVFETGSGGLLRATFSCPQN